MFFKTATRPHPQTGVSATYYRLVESYRNELGEVRQHHILTVGFLDDVCGKELHHIADGLNGRISGQQVLFEDSPKVSQHIDHLYRRMIEEKKIDRLLDLRSKSAERDWQTVDMDSIENKYVRELGAEWLCLQTLYRLQVDRYLEDRQWSLNDRNLALAHIVSRTVYPASELKTVRFIQENSSIAELLDLDASKITKDHLYRISGKLFSEKEGLEQHLSRKTNELFDLQDKIILYDLTNTYFEGEMRSNHSAKRGRSKEKRTDCPLLVLALVVNVEGFIKYSAIYEGNKSDSATLVDMIDKLQLSTSEISRKPVVVLDAGISTEANLALIVQKGYDYVCVSRSKLKKYSPVTGKSPVTVFDRKNRKIELVEVNTQESTDSEYYLQVTSEAKALKEESMFSLFKQRYEQGLDLIAKGITSKGGVKKYDKVNQRIGRLQQKYPSVHRMYKVDLQKDAKDTCTSMTWQLIQEVSVEKQNSHGIYFLRTSLVGEAKEVIWTFYNTIREIENSFRTLKTDLDLRPIFHKTDEASQAHLHLGMLAYWVVNTIRYQLKPKGITAEWREVVRVMNTQKCVTTTMINNKNEHISIRCCSKPTLKAALIYEALNLKAAPFIRKKSVVPRYQKREQLAYEAQKDTG